MRVFRGRLAVALALLVVALAGVPAAAQTDPAPRIIGGTTVPDGKYPFVAALETGGVTICGASVLSSKWVMTAAHCVTNSAGVVDVLPADLNVIIGRYDLTTGDGEVIVAADIVVHPDWDGDGDGTFEYDMALVELSTATTATPVDLATPADAGLWDPGDSATVMGWGYTNPGAPPSSTTLQEVDIPIVADSSCTTAWSPFFNASVELCGGDDTVDSCVGDSGGPLVAPPGLGGWKQIGIVSSGDFPCAHPVRVGIYAEVAALRSFVDAPMAVDDAYSLDEDGTLTTTAGVDGVADNDEDIADGTPPGGDVTLVNPPSSHDGPFTLNADGSFTYDPVADFFGTDSFTYTVEDSDGNTSNVATVTITVAPVNDEPSFTRGSNQTVLEDSGAATVAGWATNLSPGPANESGQTLTFTVTGNTNPGLFATGPVVAGAGGDLTFTPAADANGSATITLQLEDDGGTANGGDDTSPTQSFTITVAPVNDEPSFTRGSNRTVLEDSGAATVAGWATNISPGPANESGQTLTFTVTGNTNPGLFATGPVVAGAGGDLTFTPAADANGSATITLQLEDDGGTANGGDDTSPTQSFTITVTKVNDEPSFTKGPDQTVTKNAGPQSVPGWATNISAGPADEFPQVLTFTVTGNTDPGLFSAGPAITTLGRLIYTPAADAEGSADITVQLEDDGGTANGGDDTSPPQTFTITVAANQRPNAVDDAYTVIEDVLFAPKAVTGVAANDTDPEDGSPPGGNVSLVGSPPPNQPPGGFVLDLNGAFTYRPPMNENGAFTFMYTIEDSGGAISDPATVTLNVLPVNDRPTFTVGSNQFVAEDSGPHAVAGWATGMSPGPPDEAGQTLTFRVAANTKPSLFAAGPAVDAATGTLTYTLAANANGTATITLQLEDDGGTANGGKNTSSDRQFTITVTPEEDPPVAVDDNYTIAEDTNLTVAAPGVAGNDIDPEDGTPPQGAVTTVDPPANAQTFSLSVDGSFTYRGNPDFSGTDSFRYTIADSAGKASGVATVTITVSPVNDPPVAVADGPYAVAEAGSVTGNVLANDIDVDGDPLTAKLISNPLNGVVNLAADGSFTYIHGGNETTSDAFTYRAFDGTANSASVRVPITVTPVNDPPVAVDDGPITFGPSGATAIAVLRNDSDAEGSPLTIAIVSPPAHGTAVVAGMFVAYTPNRSSTASDSFTYVASDGDADSNVATVTLRAAVIRSDAVGLVDPAQGRWHLRLPGGDLVFFYGNPGDFPFVGDWDCDGIDTPGLYRQSDGFVYLRNSNTAGVADVRFFFGDPGDVPLAGDFNGDGCDTVSLYRPDQQRFFIINELGENDGGLGAADLAFTFGDPGDQPFAGDLDGDGITEVGLHRASTGLVYYRTTLTTGPADRTFVFGDPGDRMYAGDWTGFGTESVGLFRPSDTTHYLRYANSAGSADETIVQGESSWLPVGGHFR